MLDQPVSITIKGAVARTGICMTRIYALMNEGHIKARKYGRSTLIMVESLDAYIASLPERTPSKNGSDGH